MIRAKVKKHKEKRKEEALEDDEFWDKRLKIAHRKINRKKYYGVGVEIDKYTDLIEDAVDFEKAVDVLNNATESVKESFKTREDLIDKISQLITIKDLSSDSGLYADIQAVIEDSFRKGTRRLFTRDGDRIDVDEFVDETVVSELMNEQTDYIDNLSDAINQEVQQTLRKGYSKGLSGNELADQLEDKVKNVSRNRAKRIARSELTKASSRATEKTMDKAGVKKFMWLSARDSTVCEPGNFSEVFNGKEFTSCREYDGTTWDKDMAHPKPVEHSHPNCRCTLVADV